MSGDDKIGLPTNYQIMFDALHEQRRTSTAGIVLEMVKRCRRRHTMQTAGR